LRPIVRTVLVGLLSAGLLNLSTLAAGGQPLGMVVTAYNAHLGDATAAMGTNLFAGDYLHTEAGGTLRVKIGSNQLSLASSSAAILLQERNQEQNKIRVKLTQGTIQFSSPAANPVEIETPVGTVRAASGKSGFGEVTLISPDKILVAAYRGSLVVSREGLERTIAEGDAYNVSFAQTTEGAGSGNGDNTGNGNGNNQGNQQGGGYAVHNNGVLIFTAVALGAMAGLGYAIWHFANESDSAPPAN